jgi:hypothetical protein
MAGFTDANGKFFPSFIGLASTEDTWAYEQFFQAIGYEPDVILADSAAAITKG